MTVLCACFALIGACGGGAGGSTLVNAPALQAKVEKLQITTLGQTGFLTPDLDGYFADSQITSATQFSFGPSVQSGISYAYVMGHDNVSFRAFSGIIPGSSVVDQPNHGTINYTTRYLLDAIVGIEVVGNVLRSYGSIGSDNDIVLTADFDAGTLTGQSLNDQFAVNGQLAPSGNGLTGTVSWLGIEGDLTGLVGSDQVIGAFHGSSPDTVYVGGFQGNAD
ncbi:hypothetical protein [Yoonia sediminilitoris]|uniref:hypothetical protein n=1 Tax=Yoonia sediminilitoris TaxID=1286148 RepID=UPI0010570883|nr:hypothetical protein [Yoonia sediminilitoris]